MTDVVCDASIVLKWFHDDGDAEVEGSRRLLAAHRDGQLTALILDLTLYELGNVMLRALRWRSAEVVAQLDDIRSICAILAPGAIELRLAVELAEAHALTYYDAVHAAAARSRGAVLVTADRALLDAGVAEPPGLVAARLGITKVL